MRRQAKLSAVAIMAVLALTAGPVPGARADHVSTMAEVGGVLKQNGRYWNIRVR